MSTKKGNTLKKALSALLCCILVFESFSIAVAADESLDTGDQQPISKDLSGSENLLFSIAGMEETQEELVYNLSLDFMFENPQGDFKVNPGDRFSFSLPSEVFTAEDTQAPVAIHSAGAESFGNITTDVNGEKIAEYTIKSQVVEVVFCDYVKQVENIQSLFGRITMKINLQRKALTFEEQKSKWDIQTLENGNLRSVEVQLPARKTVEWSERTDEFSFSQNDENEQEKTVQFSFTDGEKIFPPMEGDTAQLNIGEDWKLKENYAETENKEKTTENYLYLAGDTEPFAAYILEEGNLFITFEKGVEKAENVSEIKGEISFEKIEPPATTEETTEIETEPAIEAETESTTEPIVTEPTEATEPITEDMTAAENNSAPVLLAENGHDIEENGVFFDFSAFNTKTIEHNIYWIDNNDSNNVRLTTEETKQELYNKVKFTASYSYKDGNEEHTGTFTRTLAELGISLENISVTDLGGTGHYVFNVEGTALPSAATVTDGEDRYNNVALTWTYALDTDIDRDNYYFIDVNKDTVGSWPGSNGNLGWYLVKSMDYNVTIEVRRGTSAMYGINDVLAELYHFYYNTYVEVGGNIVEGDSAIADIDSEEDVIWGEWVYGEFAGTNTFTVKHLPMYNLDGSEITYYIDRPEEEGIDTTKIEQLIYQGEDLLPGDDFLLETVENNLVSNFGTDTERVHNGGKLILTRTGYRTYTATKEWHDIADNSERPRLEFQLWRVAYRPNDDLSTLYQSATPVKEKTDTKTATFEVPENSKEDTQTITFENMFDPIEGITDGYLPKYDKEGFPYIYFTREYMYGESASKYRVEYGSVQSDGTIKDTLIYDQEERESNDNSIYSTGTVSNILTGNVTASAEKIWDAAAFQSELTDVKVVLKLQSRPVIEGQGDDDNWTDTEVTHKMENFIAENLDQTYSQSMPKYDNFGRQLQYRWVEEGIYQGESDENLLKDDGSFVLYQNGYNVYYDSVVTIEKVGDNYHTTILNQIEDKTEVIAIKEWDEAIPENQRTEVSLLLYRAAYDSSRYSLQTTSGELFKIDGVVDENKTPLYIFENGRRTFAGYVQETEPWKAHFTELEKYDENGHPYDYILLEGQMGKWDTDYSTTTDEKGVITTTITNAPPVGDGYKIYLRKRWIDDGDAQHRDDVVYTVYYQDDDGSFKKIQDVTITASDNWWKQVSISTEYSDKKLLVLETKVGNVELNYFSDDGTPYDPNFIESIFDLQNGGNTDSPFIQYETDHHKYEATYMMVNLENLNFYTVSNRRLGNIDITVEKNWIDGESEYENNAKRQELVKALDNLGYKLVLKLEFAPGYEDSGNILYEEDSVILVNEKVPIRDNEGGNASAIQEVNTDTANSTYYFCNLPKYDKLGTLVRYQVTEYAYNETKKEFKKLSELGLDTEYVSNSYQVSYTLSNDEHKNDKQGIAVTNQLSGTKNIFFRKEWKDTYRYNNGERPDIYLDLYRADHVKDENGNVVENFENIYLDRKWSFHDDAYYSTCNFGSMPKYDSLGYEIFYYAREKMRINKEIFDYTEVEYKYWGDPSDVSVDDDIHPDWDKYRDIGSEYGGLLESESDKTLLRQYEENGETIYLLKERGMFVNKIAADVTIDGKKIWSNIPSGFLQADLPTVRFDLYQFVQADDPGDDGDFTGQKSIASITVSDWPKQLYNGEYHFKLSYYDENTNRIDDEGNLIAEPVNENQGLLPKYNDKGELYVYRLQEKVMNFDGTDAKDFEFVFKQPVINNYAVNNGYNPQLGSVSVRKWLDTSPYTGKEKPTISFALTRSYKNDDGVYVQDPHFIEVKSINYSEFVKGYADISFTNLPVYAPNGSYYYYKVAENANHLVQGGYVMTAGIGLLAKDATGYSVSDTDNDGIVEVDGLIAITNEEDGTVPPVTQDPDPDAKNWATFKNVYETEKDASLYFGKEWIDKNNSNGSRPKTLTFEIRRSADSQSGQNNPIGETSIGSFTVDLSKDWNNNIVDNKAITISEDSIDMVKALNISVISASGNPSNWIGSGEFATSRYWLFKLEGLEIYAPNSMPWKYKITEVDTGLNGYSITANNIQFTYSKNTGSYNTMTSAISKLIKNSVETSYTMWKNWRTDVKNVNNFENKTGYTVELTADLYVAGVEAQENGTAPNDDKYNDSTLWKTVENSEFKDILRGYGSGISGTYSATVGINGTFGGKDGATKLNLSNLPMTVMYNGKVYYLKYYMIESKISLKNNSNKVVYYETLTPEFEVFSNVGKGYKGTSRLGFYLDTKAYVLSNTANNTYTETQLNIFEPVVNNKDVLNKIHDQGLKSVYTAQRDEASDLTIYPFVNLNSSKKESTFVNIIDVTSLKVKKTWENDADNIYGTREPNGSGWKIVFDIQYKNAAKTEEKDWMDFAYGNKNPTITITGNNSDESKESSAVTNLPVLGVIPNADNTGYEAVSFEYRAREIYNNKVVDDNGIYRDTYNASYVDTVPGADNNIYTSSATNHMITIELEATKDWADTYGETTLIDMTSPVTFELQYQNTNGQWTSFKTHAKVTLNGEADNVDQNDPPAYYEDTAWHAVWNFVPKIMPGSKTEEVNGEKQTIYRIVETTENSYPTDGDTVLNKDDTDPAKENSYAITNELTQLKIEKTVEKYVEGAVVDDEFVFTISGDMNNINLYYKKYNKGDGAAVQDALVGQGQMSATGQTNFELSDNQYIVIYGLKKGKTYTITETSGKYTAFYKVNNGTETEGNTASVTIPNDKPGVIDYVLFTNKRFGKITINKIDEKDQKLNGATFLLEKKVTDTATGTESWETVATKITGEDGTDGVAVFNKLDLDAEYRITETAAPDGYNKIINPIEVKLPYESNIQGSDPLYTIDGTYYYAEIEYTIGNNASLEIPTTGGSGFFNPGIWGVSALVLIALFYVIREEKKRRKAKSKL